jgi:phage gp16-like protein
MALDQLGLPYNQNRDLWAEVIAGLVKGRGRTLSDLTLEERKRFIDHLKKKGAKVKNPFVPSSFFAWKKGDNDQSIAAGARRPLSVTPDKLPLIRKINAILMDLGLEWAYADGIASRMGFESAIVEWCSPVEIYKIVQALSFHQAKTKRRYHG